MADVEAKVEAVLSAEEQAALAQAEASAAEEARAGAGAAAAGIAAATAGAALAEANAAETLNKRLEDIEWLKSRDKLTENSLLNLAEAQKQQGALLSAALEQQRQETQAALAALASSIPKTPTEHSTHSAEPSKADAAPEGQKEAENPPPKKRRII